jgi:hypothetical protein
VTTAATLYHEDTATDYASATALAATRFGQGIEFEVIQIGTDTIVFVDIQGTHTLDASDVAVALVGRTLADIDYTNIV